MAPVLSAVERLQALSLVTKVCATLNTHIGMSDKTLAEFIISMTEESYNAGYDDFYKRLIDNGLEGEELAR